MQVRVQFEFENEQHSVWVYLNNPFEIACRGTHTPVEVDPNSRSRSSSNHHHHHHNETKRKKEKERVFRFMPSDQSMTELGWDAGLVMTDVENSRVPSSSLSSSSSSSTSSLLSSFHGNGNDEDEWLAMLSLGMAMDLFYGR